MAIKSRSKPTNTVTIFDFFKSTRYDGYRSVNGERQPIAVRHAIPLLGYLPSSEHHTHFNQHSSPGIVDPGPGRVSELLNRRELSFLIWALTDYR